MYGIKEQEQADAFEQYGLKWINTSLYDDDQYAHGYWDAGGTHKIIPIFDKEDNLWSFDIFQYKRFKCLDLDTGEEVFDVLEMPELVYSGRIDVSDSEYVYKLFINLDVIWEADWDDGEPLV